jgi:hypothetical protein
MNKGIEGEITPLILLSIQPSPNFFSFGKLLCHSSVGLYRLTVGTPGLGVRHPHGVLFVFARMKNRQRGRHPAVPPPFFNICFLQGNGSFPWFFYPKTTKVLWGFLDER